MGSPILARFCEPLKTVILLHSAFNATAYIIALLHNSKQLPPQLLIAPPHKDSWQNILPATWVGRLGLVRECVGVVYGRGFAMSVRYREC